MKPVTFVPIGVIHTPFTEASGMPIQPAGATGIRGTIVLDPSAVDGLLDLGDFSHLILLYHFHRAGGPALHVTPFLDTAEHGIFATRAPRRPNPIGLSVVRLIGITGNELSIENVDMLDGTPLLDIKPYIPEMDVHPAERLGWFERSRGEVARKRSDGRFEG